MFELNIAIDKLFCITQKQCQILLEHPSLIRLRGRKKHHVGKSKTVLKSYSFSNPRGFDDGNQIY